MVSNPLALTFSPWFNIRLLYSQSVVEYYRGGDISRIQVPGVKTWFITERLNTRLVIGLEKLGEPFLRNFFSEILLSVASLQDKTFSDAIKSKFLFDKNSSYFCGNDIPFLFCLIPWSDEDAVAAIAILTLACILSYISLDLHFSISWFALPHHVHLSSHPFAES